MTHNYDSIDEDAERIGINPETWRRFKQMYVRDDLPYFQQQDDKEAFERRKQALFQRWFGYYKKCKNNRGKIIDQYNKIALMKGRE